MNLLHLKYFYEVARSGSFVEGARILRVSQPAISKMVKLLEEDLGAQLLDRTRQGVKLTEAGETLFQSASRIFTEAENAATQLKSEKRALEGEWVLGASDNIAIHLVPGVLGAFAQAHPGLRVGIFAGTSSQIKNELHYDRCQLGIFFTAVQGGEPFESRQIFETEFWVVMARKNKWIKGSTPTLAEVRKAGVPRIESRHSDYSGGFPAHFHSRKLGVTERPWMEVNHHEVKKKLVLDGYGYSFLTKHSVEEEVRSGALMKVSTARMPAPVYAAWRKGRAPGRATELFLESWRERLGTSAK